MLLLGPLGSRPDIWTPFVQALPPGTKVFIPPLEGNFKMQREQLQQYRDRKEIRRPDVFAVATGAMLAATAPNLGRIALLTPTYKIPQFMRRAVTCEPVENPLLIDAPTDSFITNPQVVITALQKYGLL